MKELNKMYINGRFVEGEGTPIDIINPATGKVITTFRSASEAQAEEALAAAQQAFKSWQFASIKERVGWLYKLRDACVAEREEFIEILAHETGKSYGVCTGEVDRFFTYFEYFGEEAKRVNDVGLHDYDSHRDSFYRVMKRPLGVVVGHLPWNGPMVFIGAKLCPAIASGCTTVLKPSTSTPLTLLKVAQMAERIDFPKGIFNVVTGPAGVIGKYLSASKIPAMITLVGSTNTGREVLNQLATSIKKVSLELGGNSPTIIMPDADMDAVAASIVRIKTHNSGQACGTVNRIFAHESIHDEFVAKLVEKVKACKVDWGKDHPDAVGSLIDTKARDRVRKLIDDSVALGAKLLYGGTIPNLPEHLKDGAFLTPAVLDDVTDDMPVAVQEVFGPVYSVLTFNDLDDVLSRSNNTDYGLGAYLFSHDSRVIGKVIEQLEFGKVQVNGGAGISPNMPHIGTKQSGVGCLFGTWSMEEYYKIKLVSIRP
jgi:succinate-semialdehyde dehydrogenase/glutarate-semialdehyde dehydrogenase